MAKFLGRNLTVALSDGGGGFDIIECQRSVSFGINNDQIDTSSRCSIPFRELIEGGVRSMSVSFAAVMNNGLTLAIIKEKVFLGTIEEYQIASDYGDSYTGMFQIVSFERAGEYQDAEQVTLNLESTGTLAYIGGGGGPTPPADFASLWNLSKYTTPIQDSYQLPAFVLIDDGPANIDLEIQNPISDGIDELDVVRIEHTRSAPDGMGVWAVDNGQNNRRWSGLAAAPIDFASAGAWAMGGWIMPSLWLNIAGVLWSQGSTYDNNFQVSIHLTTNVYPAEPTINVRVLTQFTTTGQADFQTPEFEHNKWFHLWVQQDGATCQIWINGLMVVSSSPVGASGVSISNANPFRMWGSPWSGASVDAYCGLGMLFHRYTRMLTPSEITNDMYGSADNIDFVTKLTLTDNGDAGSQISNNVLASSVGYGVDRKSYDAGEASGSPIAKAAWLMQKPIFRHDPPVEMQFRVNGGLEGIVGLSAQHNGGGHYLTNFNVELGIYLAQGYVILNDVFENTIPGSVPVPDGAILTWRISPPIAYGGSGHYWIRVNDVAYFDKDLPANWWTSISEYTHFAIGNSSAMGANSVDVLSTPSEMVYPLGAGFTFSRAM